MNVLLPWRAASGAAAYKNCSRARSMRKRRCIRECISPFTHTSCEIFYILSSGKWEKSVRPLILRRRLRASWRRGARECGRQRLAVFPCGAGMRACRLCEGGGPCAVTAHRVERGCLVAGVPWVPSSHALCASLQDCSINVRQGMRFRRWGCGCRSGSGCVGRVDQECVDPVVIK